MPWLSVCFGRRQKSSKRPSISPPLHLLLKPGQLQQHAFRAKPLRRPRPCHLCHQLVVRQASCCRVCNYICHEACEAKGGLKGRGSNRYRDTSWQIHRQWKFKRNATFPTVEASCGLLDNNENKQQCKGGSAPSSPTVQKEEKRCNGAPKTSDNNDKPPLTLKINRSESVPATPVAKYNENIPASPESFEWSDYEPASPVSNRSKYTLPATPVSRNENSPTSPNERLPIDLEFREYFEGLPVNHEPRDTPVSRKDYELQLDLDDSVPVTPRSVSRRDSAPASPVSRTSESSVPVTPRSHRNALFLDEDMAAHFDYGDDEGDYLDRLRLQIDNMHGGSGGVVTENGVVRVTNHSKALVLRNNNNTMLQTSSSSSMIRRGMADVSTLNEATSTPLRGAENMQLNYVTERLLALWFPSEGLVEARRGLTRAAALLRNKHGDHYMVFNLSPRSVARVAAEEAEEMSLRELGWARGLAPPLERLCALCKEVDAWLCAGPHRLAVLSALGQAGRERLGVAIAAFMHYSLICGGDEQALDRYAMAKFLEERVGEFQQPSNKRYVGYFSGLLSGSIKINAQPLYLTHVTLIGAPAFEPLEPSPSSTSPLLPISTSLGGGCRLFLKVYQGLVPVHTSPVYHVSGATRRLTVALDRSLQLRGDVMVRCYHRHPPHQAALLAGEGRELIFSCQFHTCAVSDFNLTFSRQELDHACLDLRFPLDGAVEFTFSPNSTPRHPSPAPTPAVPVDHSADPVTRWDSLDTLLSPVEPPDGAAMNVYATPSHHQHLRVATSPVNQPLGVDTGDGDQHSPNSYTPGPLDGSLYATVSKKSPSGQTPPGGVAGASGSGGVHSPHTVSMDSGISSAGNGQPAPGAGAAATPGATDHHKMLDQLLSDMLLTVENIPDLPPTPKNLHSSPIEGIDDSLRALQEFQFSSPVSGGGDTTGHHSSSSFSSACAVSGAQRQDQHQRPQPPRRATSPTLSPPSASLRQPPQLLPSVSEQTIVSTSAQRGPSSSSSSATPAAPKHLQLHVQELIESSSSDIPYHARQDSQPFTYGAVPPQQDMSRFNGSGGGDHSLNHVHPRLASPSLVRKASGGKKPFDTSTTTTTTNGFNFSNNNNTWSPSNSRNNKSWNTNANTTTNTSTLSTTSTEKHHYFTNGGSLLIPSTNGRRGKSSLDDDETRDLLDGYPDGTLSSTSTSNGGLTWLQRQQQKLRDRREQQLRFERHPHETRLMTELRSVQHRILKPGASSTPRRPSTEDGYASDTTLLLSGLEEDHNARDTPSPHYASPLVIHTGGVAPPASHNYHKSGAGLSAPSSPLLPSRSSSRDRTLRYQAPSQSHHQELATIMAGVKPLSRQKSDTSFDRERPFVAVKRAHDMNRRMDSQLSPPVSPLSLLTGQPMGPASYYTLQNTSPRQLHQPLSSVTMNGGGPDLHYQPCKPVNHTTSPPHFLPSPQTGLDDWDGRGSPRPQTPAFPVHPRTPYSNNSQTPQPGDSPSSGLPPKSPTAQRRQLRSYLRKWPSNASLTSRERSMSPGAEPGTPSLYGGQSRRSSVHSSGGETVTQEVSPANVKFVRDTSRYWYKPNISREEAIALLREQAPGTFVVRDSNSFPGAFGLALKVAVPPPTPPGGVSSRQGGPDELVRHFLIEPTSRGVKLKGCANEPVFSSLSALVYQHSVTAIALPCRLILPDKELGLGGTEGRGQLTQAQQLLALGAACNVLYLITVDTESLTGPQAVRRAIAQLFATRPLPKATVVHFKVANQGITLTDNKRTLFFRRHYPVNTISHCGLDPDDHRWLCQRSEDGMPISSNRCFGFVARKPASQLSDNQCHIFAELEPEQPATAIVNFVSKVMMSGNQSPSLTKANIV